MSRHDAAISALALGPWICERCGCQQNQACRIEIIVTRPNGQRAMLLADECGWSAPGLCTACDERLLPELRSLLDIWRQLGPIATAFRALVNEPRPQESGNPPKPKARACQPGKPSVH
jgi:hypothetical protein